MQLFLQSGNHLLQGGARLDGEVFKFARISVMVIQLNTVLAFTPLGVSPAIGADAASHHGLFQSFVCWSKHLCHGPSIPCQKRLLQ